MCGRTIASGEGLSGHDEGGCVRTKVLEEIGKTVEENESICASCCSSKLVIRKAFRRGGKHECTLLEVSMVAYP